MHLTACPIHHIFFDKDAMSVCPVCAGLEPASVVEVDLVPPLRRYIDDIGDMKDTLIAAAEARGAAAERERLLPLLERCLRSLEAARAMSAGQDWLVSPAEPMFRSEVMELLRRELSPLPAQADRPASEEQAEGEGARPEHDSAQLRDLRIRGQSVEEASDHHEEQGEQDSSHALRSDAESVPPSVQIIDLMQALKESLAASRK